ncbi:hypothetical protein ACYZT4_10975 [Pseudomonas sp. GB2N2]
MAKTQEVGSKEAAHTSWYEVLEVSYIGDRLYTPGQAVQYDGEAGSNLREITDKEAAALSAQ